MLLDTIPQENTDSSIPANTLQETSKVSTLDYQKGEGNNGPRVSAAWQKAPWKVAGPFYPGIKNHNRNVGTQELMEN